MTLPEAWRMRACVVFEVADAEQPFAPEELRQFSSEKRKREWMLSRIAEKELRRRGVAGAHVSYSHSGAYGAAAIDHAPIGIDVEVIRDLSPRAAHLFLTDEEEAEAARCAIDHALLHFWSAKEARWKQLGGAIATLKRVPLQLTAVSRHGLQFDTVETQKIGDVVVALTRPTS